MRVAHERARQLEAGIGLAFGKVRGSSSTSIGRRLAVGGVGVGVGAGVGEGVGEGVEEKGSQTTSTDGRHAGEENDDLEDCFSFGVGLGEIDPELLSQGAVLRPVTSADFKEVGGGGWVMMSDDVDV